MAFLDAFVFDLPIGYVSDTTNLISYGVADGPYGEKTFRGTHDDSFNESYSRIMPKNLPANDTIFLHFHQEGGYNLALKFYDAAGTPHARIEIDLPALGFNQIGKWHWIGFKFVRGDSGTWELRVDGQTVATGSGDFAANSNPIEQLYFFEKFHVCNLILHDETGSGVFTDFIDEECRLSRLSANGDGNYSGYTPSEGNNYENVDGFDGDNSYNESGTVGAKDSYVFEDTPSLPGFTPLNAIIETVARKTDTTATQAAVFTRSGSTDTERSTHTLAATYDRFIDDLGAISESDINALEAGLEVKAA